MLLTTPSFWAPQITAATESLHYFHEDYTIGSTVTSKHNCSIISGWFSGHTQSKNCYHVQKIGFSFYSSKSITKESINNFQTKRDFSQGKQKHHTSLFLPLLKSAKSIFYKETHTYNPFLPCLRTWSLPVTHIFFPCKGMIVMKAFQSLQRVFYKNARTFTMCTHIHTSHWCQKNSWNMNVLR